MRPHVSAESQHGGADPRNQRATNALHGLKNASPRMDVDDLG